MADNVLYTQGTGTNIATDDVGSVHFQKIKLDVGADGTSLQPAGSIPVYIVSGIGAYAMNDPFVDAVAMAGQLDDTATTVATENNVAPLRITIGRALHIYIASGTQISTSTISSGSASVSSITLLASNSNRRMATFYNNANVGAYIKLGAVASTSRFTVKLLPGSYYELPLPCWIGIIDAIFDAGGTGAIFITELT